MRIFRSILLLGMFLTMLPSALAGPKCSLTPPRARTEPPIQSKQASVNQDVLVTAWYPGWLGKAFTPSMVPWKKYTAMTFAFAATTPDPSVLFLDQTSLDVLPDFVAIAKQNNVSALLSVGGWTGSQHFSTAMATPESRTLFANALFDLVEKYQLDGLDFDWEYPNKQGIGCNTISPDDSENLLVFLQGLRATPVGQRLTLSAAVGIAPFNGKTGQPMSDVSGFADALDYIEIMAYDIFGSWSTNGAGPNAPLDDACAPVKAGSAKSAVQAWTSAKFPASQIALGVPAYGHSFRVENAAFKGSASSGSLYPPFDKWQQPRGDSQDGEAGTDQCGNPVGTGGIFNFWGLIEDGFLNTNGTVASGKEYRFDSCSQTPFVYDPSTQVMVAYDDASSFAAKGQFINDAGLKGLAMWHVAGDADDILLDAISEAMNIEYVCT